MTAITHEDSDPGRRAQAMWHHSQQREQWTLTADGDRSHWIAIDRETFEAIRDTLLGQAQHSPGTR